LLENNALLTRDNMAKRGWTGDTSCAFCAHNENIEHLFFQCTVAKCVWGIVGACLGATNIPNNVPQYRTWIQNVLPGGKAVHHFGFSVVCWAIWKARNKAIFDKKTNQTSGLK
jgi:hypothetical protein